MTICWFGKNRNERLLKKCEMQWLMKEKKVFREESGLKIKIKPQNRNGHKCPRDIIESIQVYNSKSLFVQLKLSDHV